MTQRRPTAIRKSDLAPAFEAARAAGYDQVSIEVETHDGQRYVITAGSAGKTGSKDLTPYEKWRAGRAAS